MIASLVTLISLNLTLSLVQDYGLVAGTLPITAATPTTPIQVSSPRHGIPLGRSLHGVLTGATGMPEVNGLWIATPKDQDTLTLTSMTAQGIVANSVGTNAYTGGGALRYAFPDYSILLGRRLFDLSSSVASPRIVFIPTQGRAWDFDPYVGIGAPAESPPIRGSLESQSAKLQPQLATEYATFDVHVTGSAPIPDPDYGDFEATQFIVHSLYAVLFDACGPRAKVLREAWVSQGKDAGSKTQRGQHWCGTIEMQIPVYHKSLQFVPVGTFIEETIEPVNPLVPQDQTVIDIH